MAVTVFDADGNECSVEPVDAREIVALGGSYAPGAEPLPEPNAKQKVEHPAEKGKKKVDKPAE